MNVLSGHEEDQTKAAGHKMIDESQQWLLFTIDKDQQHDRIGYIGGIGKLTMIGLLEFELLRLKNEIAQGIYDGNDEEEES